MKKQFMLLVSIMLFAFAGMAQTVFYFPLKVKNDDGSVGSYHLQLGDKLVYQVKAGSNEYEFIVTLNGKDEKGINFNYEMTNKNKTHGHVMIGPKAAAEATKYVNYFKGGELSLTDACTVWLSEKNFNDMPKKKTLMQFDNGSPETFYRPENDEVNPVIKLKGKETKLYSFMLNNAEDGKGDKTLWVNNTSTNPLIIKMDLGWTIVLKEIR